MSDRTGDLIEQLTAKRSEVAALERRSGFDGEFPKQATGEQKSREIRQWLLLEIASLERELAAAARSSY